MINIAESLDCGIENAMPAKELACFFHTNVSYILGAAKKERMTEGKPICTFRKDGVIYVYIARNAGEMKPYIEFLTDKIREFEMQRDDAFSMAIEMAAHTDEGKLISYEDFLAGKA